MNLFKIIAKFFEDVHRGREQWLKTPYPSRHYVERFSTK
jgi:hypothetical protein